MENNKELDEKLLEEFKTLLNKLSNSDEKMRLIRFELELSGVSEGLVAESNVFNTIAFEALVEASGCNSEKAMLDIAQIYKKHVEKATDEIDKYIANFTDETNPEKFMEIYNKKQKELENKRKEERRELIRELGMGSIFDR